MTRHIGRIILLFLALLAARPQAFAQGEGWFTLTNSPLYFFDGNEGDTLANGKDDPAYQYRTGFDMLNNPQEGVAINDLGTHHYHSTYHTTAKGQYYLKLDTTDASNPTIESTTSFSPLCVWYRTGYTGYYYQTWKGPGGVEYEYYLTASSSEGLYIVKHRKGSPLSKQTTWYNWDFGAAITEEQWRNGQMETNYYWIVCEDRTSAGAEQLPPVWKLSEVPSYQRPDAEKYTNFRMVNSADESQGNKWDGQKKYFWNVALGGGENAPRGSAALYLPVEVIDHGRDVPEFQRNTGLTDIGVRESSISFGSTVNVNATVSLNYGTIVLQHAPKYVEYHEETYRRGINLNYRNRSQEIFRSAGVAKSETAFFYRDGMHDYPPDPSSGSVSYVVDSVVFSIDAIGSRYLRLVPDSWNETYVPNGGSTYEDLYPMGGTCEQWSYEIEHGYYGSEIRCVDGMAYMVDAGINSANVYNQSIYCYDVPSSAVSSKIYATVYMSSDMDPEGVQRVQTLETTIRITPQKNLAKVESHSGPAIKGSVFGGGRMANVTGNTKVTVHNADTIYALYGGNDIAGWVQGSEGATIQIGTSQTNKDHPVHIGWVYGGGCGYYSYSGVYDAANPNAERSFASRLGYGQYCFNGNVYKFNTPSDIADSLVVDPDVYDFEYDHYDGDDFAIMEDGDQGLQDGKIGGTLPYVKTAHITIGEKEQMEKGLHYDSKGHDAHEHNDYILIDSVFGGAENAFIGVTADGTHAKAVTVEVNGGTIMALFGGNNYGGAVADKASVTIEVNCTKLIDEADMETMGNTVYSGYGRDFGIRNLYGGGNMVASPHSELFVYGGMIDTAFLGGNRASVKSPIARIACERSQTNPPQLYTIGSTTIDGHFVYTNPTMDTTNGGRNQFDGFEPDRGLYNIRMLFGGNNRAPMENLAFISLYSGGLGSVYGGGNRGDMLNASDVSVTAQDYMDPSALTALTYDLHHAFDDAEGFITEPLKMSSIVAARENSHVIADYIYGGSRRSNVKHSCGVYLAGGNVSDVFGGNDVSGDVGSLHDGGSYVVVTKNAVVQGNVYGGSDGYYHFDDGTGHYDESKLINTMYNVGVDYDPFNEFSHQLIPTLNHANVFINGGLIKGNVVTGGNMADVGFSDKKHYINDGGTEHEFDLNGDYDPVNNPYGLGGPMRGTARLMITGNSEVWGNVFGGGANASVWGLSQVWVKGSPVVLGSLFAGNDCVGSVHSRLPYQFVVDYYRYYYDNVFDKSVAIAATHEDSLTYMQEHMLDTDSAAAELANQAEQKTSSGENLNRWEDNRYQPNYASYVRIEGTPIINSVYGSGNGAWNYPQYDRDGNATWDYEGARPQFENVYVSETMAGDRPNQESTYIDINTSGGFIDTVFGGGAGSSVNTSVTVLLNTKALNNPAYPLTKIENHVKPLSERLGRRFVGSRDKRKGKGEEENYPNYVGTIFGGNNFDDMANCVPEIQLLKGNVKNVYGGGNAGDMKAYAVFDDACKKPVERVSSHVLVESDNVTVTDSVFGGCRMSNISGMTFVDVRHTSKDGIQYLYGGNDISGNVGGNTRIDVSGGVINRIWGGSNGRYDFVAVGPNLYNVYRFGKYDASDPDYGLITVADRPTVDSTHINLWGGRIGASVFTGGSMADCNATCLIVDDDIEKRTDEYGQKVCNATFDSAITIIGAVYGGGEGRWDDLNARDFNGKRWGNINGSTHVHLYHAKDVTSAKAYGGGGGGDVNDTYIRTYETWNSPFDQMFGGCWGSNVNGTTHLVFDGKELVRELFGGNDFAGYVYATDMTINSGNFTDVFGGGNGEYPNSYYTQQHAGALDPEYSYVGAWREIYSDTTIEQVVHHRYLEHPNTEYVHITVNATKDTNVNVWTNIYGGGKVGTVYPLQKDELGGYKYLEDENLHRIPDTTRVLAAAAQDGDSIAFKNPLGLSYIVMNIHGGRYHQDVFGGGRGPSAEQIYEASQNAVEAARTAGITDEDELRAAGDRAVEDMKHPIVYGLKVVNMDRGDVYHSLYGGSEYVHDGYPAECKIPLDGNGQPTWNPSLSSQLALTSMRPSSIVNVTGGMVEHNIYGAGYMGNVFGSVYLNLGVDAIDSCTVWRNSYAESDTGVYRMFKPGSGATGAGGNKLSDTLKIHDIVMNESVFAGANWGEGAGATQLTTRGFYGGESRLYIDGKKYNTSNNDQALEDGSMFISRSVLGSGTSVEGGDIHSQVEIRNYGATDGCGQPVRTLESIQRTDSLWLHNTAIWLTGATDANSVNLTNKYTMSRIGDACYRGYNVTEFDAPLNEVGNMAFYEQSSIEDEKHTSEVFRTPYIEVPEQELDTQDELSVRACGQKQSICGKTFMVNANTPDKRHTLLILNNGIEFTIGQTEYPISPTSGQFKYGFVKGFAFATTPGGVNSLISARFKLKQASLVSTNPNDGGFMSPCDTCNKTVALASGYSNINPTWTYAHTTTDEFPYTNYGSTDASGLPGTGSYRVWKIGDTLAEREREATLLAHVNPSKLDQDAYVKTSTTNTLGVQNLAVAEVSFELPATVGGNYYTLRWQEDIEIDGSNMMMNLVDSAWSPTLGTQSGGNVNMTQRLGDIDVACNKWLNDVSGQGTWKIPSNHDEPKGVKKILSEPENSFGLVMVPDNNFALKTGNTEFDMPTIMVDDDNNPSTPRVAASTQPTQDEANLVISGQQRVNSNYLYTSPKVYGQTTGEPVKPSMRLYLTYSPTFASTFTGTVIFYLNEFNANGDTVGTVKVKVNIQTIIDELQDMEQDVLAMYNGGRTNEYTRKIIIPGLGEERRLYIDGIRWMPTKYDGTDTTAAATSSAFGQTDRFSLVGDTTSLTSTDDPSYPHDLSMADHNNNIHKSHNRFGLTLIPTNDVAEASRQFNGWGGTTYPINLYRLAYPTGNDAVKTVDWDDNDGTEHDTVAYRDLTEGGTTKGYFVGTLDGRGSAGLDVKLNFDGSRTYDQLKGNSYVGKLQLHMKTYYERGGTNEQRDDFTVTVYVKTRAHGDTIYVASTDHLQRCIPLTVDPSTGAGSNPCCIDLYPYNSAYNPHNAEGTPDYTPSDIGKRPSLYVQTLTKALDNDIYQEGDVIAILDTVQVTSVVNITGNKSLHVVAPLGPPIEVIRYDGHHHELPDEASVFRGAMIKVSNDGHFTSQNIAFHGGAGAVIKKVKRNASGQAVANDGTTIVNSCSNLAFETGSSTYVLGGQQLTYSYDKFPDTNRAFGPIIEVTDGGLASLKDGSLVHHNWNAYGTLASQRNADSLTNKPEFMGAISITRGGKLQLKSNVEISHNFTHTMWNDKVTPKDSVAVQYAPGNGNIYVDGGTLELTDTKRETAVTITDNYLMNPAIHDPEQSISWWEVANHVIVSDNGTINIPERWALKSSEIENWNKANVYLTRTEPTTVDDYYKRMNDLTSDVIVVSGTVGDSTKIGVRKWFPGMQDRDTIRIASVSGGNIMVLDNAVQNGAFIADDGFRVFYNSVVNTTQAYFFRCASFKHQWYVATGEHQHLYVDPVHEYDNNLTLKSGDVLKFGYRHNVCPQGGDSLIYRVQGGFMPYTFTWTDPAKTVTLSTKETPYRNTQVQYDLTNTSLANEERYAKYAESMSDTLLLPYESISSEVKRKWNHLLVTAIDATGECELHKYIDIRINMDRSVNDPVTYMNYTDDAHEATDTLYTNGTGTWQNTPSNGFTDTSSSVKAIVSRNFKGVQITPRVWVNRDQGSIKATIDGDRNDYVYQDEEDGTHELDNVLFCPGKVIHLNTVPKVDNAQFIMWDFDPYYRPLAPYVVPSEDSRVTAYYGPKNYWFEYINTATLAEEYYDDNNTYSFGVDDTAGKSFVNTYHGDVHIYNEKGLAWLISRVNGMNGQQSRSFRFNRVIIHPNNRVGSNGIYDMKDYLWTPLGTQQHPFMGRMFGTGDDPAADLPFRTFVLNESDNTDTLWKYDSFNPTNIHEDAWYEPVVIRNIIVNEPQMTSAGLFGHIDSAGLYNIAIHGELVRGSQYVGGLAGISAHSYVRRSEVKSDIEDSVFYDENPANRGIPTTILTSHYITGGMLGKSNLDTVTASEVAAKFVGDAVYSGGGIGYGTGSYIYNVTGQNFNRQQGLYLGGIAGFLNDTMPYDDYPTTLWGRLFGSRKGTPVQSKVQNNYFRIVSDGNAQRLGGVVGYSENTVIENNYVYGELGANHVGGVVAMAGSGTNADYNYYAAGSAQSPTYRQQGDASLGHTGTFEGEGTNVQMSAEAYGTTNLTHALNRWVREHNQDGDHFLTWRNDLDDENNGYPVFGLPDRYLVTGHDTVEGCGSVLFEGVTYFSNAAVTIDVPDPDEFTDSTVTMHVLIHNSARTILTDSADINVGYEGYGFVVSPTEAALLAATIEAEGSARLILSDTLQTQYGCDSIVTLMLIFTGTTQSIDNVEVGRVDISVYPNPTQDEVNVEAKGMSRVEIYDNEGRRLEDYTVNGDIYRLSLARYSSGMYFLRIHTPRGVTIQKVVKR